MDIRIMREFTTLILLIFCLCRLSNAQGCNGIWITQPKTSSPGGTRVTGSSTPSSCQSICASDPKCTGTDFNGNKECWLIYSGTIIQNLDDWVTHYELKRDGRNSCTAACPTPKSIGYVETRDAHVIGGSGVPSATTMESCERMCFNNSNCRGFDWDVLSPTAKCWLVINENPIQDDAPGVVHYHKECSDGGLKIVTPGYVAPVSQQPTKAFSTVNPPPGSTVPVDLDNWEPTDPWIPAEMVEVQAHAIKPAYIVLAGLGAGCILMVIVGISVICCYPLKGGKGGGGGRKIFRKTKKTKTAKVSNNGELHTRRPKTLNEENIDMGTLSARQTYNDHNTYNSHKERHSTEVDNQVAYAVDHDTHASRSSRDIHSDHGSHASRHSAANRNSNNLDHVSYGGSTLDHKDRNSNTMDHNTYGGSTLDHKDRQSTADRDSNGDRNSTLGHKDHHDYGHHDDDHTAYNTISEEVHEHDDHNRDEYD